MNWIYEKNNNNYAEFIEDFTFNGGNALLKISVNFKYAAYINGKFVANEQYADLPEYKSVDTINITGFLSVGKNRLHIIAAHSENGYSIVKVMPRAVAFEISSGDKILAFSSAETLSRASANYSVGDRISPQQGLGYKYDFTNNGGVWEKSVEVKTGFIETARPILKTIISEPLSQTVVAQGLYKYRYGETAAEQMQNAWLSTLRFTDMTGKSRIDASSLTAPVKFESSGGDGTFVIADLKAESVGYLSLSVTVENSCRAILGWGEHLTDLRVRTEREGRNFATEIILKQGQNVLDDYICRIGCRYLCLFVEAASFILTRLTIRETAYPFKELKKDFGDRLLNKIYETGKRTLTLCAHEHYEDCPWREQALYGMDSRNQMLFGYGVFKEYEFPRASLSLFAKSLRNDGLIPLCAPSEMDITIPSFSAYWLIAIYENAKNDYNEPFIRGILPEAERALETFIRRSGEKGASTFTEPQYWNFHEWSEGLDGGNFNRDYKVESAQDGILTALLSIAANGMSELEKLQGDTAKAKEYNDFSDKMKRALENFYDAEKGLYASYVNKDGLTGYHAYMQAAVIIAGGANKERSKALCQAIKNPVNVVDMTFAAFQFKYDAIMSVENDLAWCVEDISKVFGKMLFSGATSYYETALGEADFNDAGSLCHGWAAVACYFFDKYLSKSNRP